MCMLVLNKTYYDKIHRNIRKGFFGIPKESECSLIESFQDLLQQPSLSSLTLKPLDNKSIITFWQAVNVSKLSINYFI